MKSNQHQLEDDIQKKHAELSEKARRKGELFGKRNLPQPHGDNLTHYVEDLKTGYDNMKAEVLKAEAPASHFSEAKIEHDSFKERHNELSGKIEQLEREIQNDEYALGSFHPNALYARIQWTILAGFIIVIGEIIFNTKSFQVTGENMLFALILSISVSFAVMVCSHLVAFLYKMARNAFQRRLLVIGSLAIITGVFIALAIFRSQYLAAHDITISPIYFVVFNLFFFLVSSVLSFFVLPTWQELKHNAESLKLHKTIKRKKHDVASILNEKKRLKENHEERTKFHLRSVNKTKYSTNVIDKLYLECIAIFKATNLAYRTDGQTPDCFSQEPPPTNTDDFILK